MGSLFSDLLESNQRQFDYYNTSTVKRSTN